MTQTRVLPAADPECDRNSIVEAAQMIRRGGLVVIPTETVYGIAADALNPQAVAGIFRAKDRPQDNPLIAHIADFNTLYELTRSVPAGALALAEHFWPGPLTMILPKSEIVPDVVSAGLDTVAIRMPAHPVALAVIRAGGVPLAAPSANRSGRPSPTMAAHCVQDLDGRVDLILDGGSCAVGVESTVISLVGEVPRLLRPGAVTPEQLRGVLGELELDPAVFGDIPDGTTVSSPGMKYRHYAPRAKVVLLSGSTEQVAGFLQEHAESGVFGLVFDEDLNRMPPGCIGYGSQKKPQEQAEKLFAALRELDDRGAALIYAHAPPAEGMGLAVRNRLVRAAGFEEIILHD